MKLYYSPGACSQSPHIALREAGLAFTPVLVQMKTKTLEDGSDFGAVNPKGYVPVLELADGSRLTEGPAIVQYIADQAPDSGLAPPNGTLQRYHLQEWLNFTTSELHKNYAPLFYDATPADYKAIAKQKLRQRLEWVDGQLEGKEHLLGGGFTVADAYLFVVTGWSGHVGVELGGLDRLAAFRERVAARPAVQATLRAEGLLQ